MATTRRMSAERRAQTFWARVAKGADSECWEWMGKSRHTFGYGLIAFNQKLTGAHRVAYILSFGEIGEGMCVCHRCDNPSCCNPSHLFIGTSAENTADMIRKGRNHKGAYADTSSWKRGSEVNTSRLSEADVLSIHSLHSSGVSMRRIAAMFGVSSTAVSYIIRGRNWSHLHPSNRSV